MNRKTINSAAAPLKSNFLSIIPISSSSTIHLVAALAFSAITLVLMASFAMAQQQQERPTQGQQAPAATAPAAAQRSRGPAAAPGSLTFNTVITKLNAGQQIFSNTISRPDLEAAKKACEGQDFIWIEMQHSTLTWRETQNLIEVIVEAGSIPFIRVPSANVGDIQKATDAGALGIVVPMVDSVEEARNAVLYSKFPIGNSESPNTRPWGHRSAGGNRASALWGPGYATNANNNILVMIQIENPAGVGIIDDILEEVEGIDIVMVASNDFGVQAGDRDGSPTYNAREEIVRKSVLAHGKILAGPSRWQTRPGYMLFQGRRSATNTGYPAR
ncbi:MAG: aldolase/citrate lyase family protein [Verrucomicrobia bacterium]|nr:aldolase/citrate lyase family protein [Verrucomicrobiota bacterium]